MKGLCRRALIGLGGFLLNRFEYPSSVGGVDLFSLQKCIDWCKKRIDMKVLLLKDVSGVGQKNDIKDVNDGFARNFLFPKKLAVTATGETVRSLEQEKAGKQQKQVNEQKKYQDIAEKIKSIEVVITTKVGEKGKAFGSIGVHQIKQALEKQGIDIEEEWIELEEPLKTTGSKQIALKFPHGIFGSVSVMIKPE